MKASQARNRIGDYSEVELVRAAKHGDVEAFELLVQRYSGMIFRVAFQISRSRDDAEDITQETFLKAFQHISNFEGRARISTWMTRIAVNVALTRMRGLRPTRTLFIHDEPGGDQFESQHIADWRPNPEQLYTGTELRGILRRALESLPKSYGTVFWLRDVEGFSISETAETLGISESAVKTRLSRARLQLRERLSNYFRVDRNATGPTTGLVRRVLLPSAP